MKTEEELMEMEKLRQKRARTVAAVFATLAITALICLIYAFFQEAAAKRLQMETAIELESCRKRVEEAEAQAELATKKVEQLLIDAAIAKEIAESANQSKKK